MAAHDRIQAVGLRRADTMTRSLGREARDIRLRAGVSQSQLGRTLRCSRQWIGDFEMGRLSSVDLRRLTLLFAFLGHSLSTKAFPTGEPIRDAGAVRLLERFNARLSPTWRRSTEAVMPVPGDLRAWDELLRGPVSIGVEAETRPRDLQALERSMAAKQRDSGVDRIVLVVLASERNRQLLREHIGLLRQTFPLDTRATLAALGAGQDPGANGLVLL